MKTTVAFIPNGLRYLVLPDEARETAETIGGVTITKPKTGTEKPNEGIVVAVGQGTNAEACFYGTDTRVVFGKYAGVQINVDGTEYLILAESEILGERPELPDFQQ